MDQQSKPHIGSRLPFIHEPLPKIRGDESMDELRQRLRFLARHQPLVGRVADVAERFGIPEFQEFALLACVLVEKYEELTATILEYTTGMAPLPFTVHTHAGREVTYCCCEGSKAGHSPGCPKGK